MRLAIATSMKNVILVAVILVLSGCASIEESRKFHLDKLEAELEMLRQMPKEERAKFFREMLVIMADDEEPQFAAMTSEGKTRMINLVISTLCTNGSFSKGIRGKYAASLTKLAPEDRIRISEKTFSLTCETLMP